MLEALKPISTLRESSLAIKADTPHFSELYLTKPSWIRKHSSRTAQSWVSNLRKADFKLRVAISSPTRNQPGSKSKGTARNLPHPGWPLRDTQIDRSHSARRARLTLHRSLLSRRQSEAPISLTSRGQLLPQPLLLPESVKIQTS